MRSRACRVALRSSLLDCLPLDLFATRRTCLPTGRQSAVTGSHSLAALPARTRRHCQKKLLSRKRSTSPRGGMLHQNDDCPTRSTPRVMFFGSLSFSYETLFGMTRLSTIPTTVESATPPKLNTKSLPTANCSMPPPMPMTMMTDEIVKLRLS